VPPPPAAAAAATTNPRATNNNEAAVPPNNPPPQARLAAHIHETSVLLDRAVASDADSTLGVWTTDDSLSNEDENIMTRPFTNFRPRLAMPQRRTPSSNYDNIVDVGDLPPSRPVREPSVASSFAELSSPPPPNRRNSPPSQPVREPSVVSAGFSVASSFAEVSGPPPLNRRNSPPSQPVREPSVVVEVDSAPSQPVREASVVSSLGDWSSLPSNPTPIRNRPPSQPVREPSLASVGFSITSIGELSSVAPNNNHRTSSSSRESETSHDSIVLDIMQMDGSNNSGTDDHVGPMLARPARGTTTNTTMTMMTDDSNQSDRFGDSRNLSMSERGVFDSSSNHSASRTMNFTTRLSSNGSDHGENNNGGNGGDRILSSSMRDNRTTITSGGRILSSSMRDTSGRTTTNRPERAITFSPFVVVLDGETSAGNNNNVNVVPMVMEHDNEDEDSYADDEYDDVDEFFDEDDNFDDYDGTESYSGSSSRSSSSGEELHFFDAVSFP